MIGSSVGDALIFLTISIGPLFGLREGIILLGLSEQTANIFIVAASMLAFFIPFSCNLFIEIERSKEAEISMKNCKIDQLQAKLEQVTANHNKTMQELEQCQNQMECTRLNIYKIIESSSQANPLLAKQVADFYFACDKQIAFDLKNKPRPALSAAKQVQQIAKEKRILQAELKASEYQLDFYEAMFPWLLDFKEVPVQEAVRYIKSAESDYDGLHQWLSPEEYANLSSAEKNQRALDRYLARNKSNWEAGIDYERYIGYLFESQGKTVSYVGATMGLEDRGIDIIAKDRKETVVIQCKRYSAVKNKYVHENTVAQLYGVAAVYKMENPKIDVIPMIYTSSALSEEAKHFAGYLNIEVRENVELEPYPMIKCNISKDGEKIYHLPFDQQYDRISIAKKKGACYVATVAEAEEQGFRRAYKWKPKAENSPSD